MARPRHRPVIAAALTLACLGGLALSVHTQLAANLTPVQQAALADFQAFANRVTAHYGRPMVRFKIVDEVGHGRNAARMAADGRLILSPGLLSTGWYTESIVAHELGHWVLGHRDDDPDEIQPQKEIDANAQAVKNLEVGRGMTEEAAFRQVLRWILRNADLLANGPHGLNRGHAHPCDEAVDLMHRYPAYRASWAQCTR